MPAVAQLATIGLVAAIVAIGGSPSAGATEADCALPQPILDYPIARITVDSERHMAFIYTLDGSKIAVDPSGNLVVWTIGNDRHLRPDPDFAELEGVRNFEWQAAVSSSCSKHLG
jgi:hypothetical protein